MSDTAVKSRTELAELIDEGQPLVISLASQIFPNIPVRVEFDDLIAYGQVGLAEAAREFDPEEGCKFTTFAYYRIRGAIYDGLSKMSWTSRAYYRRMRYEQLADQVLQEEASGGDSDRDDSVGRSDHAAGAGAATRAGASAGEKAEKNASAGLRDDAGWFRRVTDRLAIVYLSTEGGDDGRDASESLEDRGPSPAALAVSREISEKLRTLVGRLPPVEQQLVHGVYFEGWTLQEGADRLGISKSWASRLHAKALEQLAKSLRQWGITD